MEFDRWTLLFLKRRHDAPALSESEESALQDAHLAYLAKMHAEGRLLAAGPVRGDTGSDVAGVCLYAGSVEESRGRAVADPAVKAGVFEVELFSWWVPAHVMRFEPFPFPRSMSEAEGR